MKTLNLVLNRRLMTLLALMALSIAAVGCSDDDDPTAVINGNMGTGAMLRVAHASPNAPAVDVYAKGVAAPVVVDLEFTETTDYLELAPGKYVFQLRAAGADPSSAPAYETGELDIPEGAVITALAAGLLGSADADDMLRVIPLVEDWQDPGAGNAAVRIIHAGADAPAVAIDVANDGMPEINDFARFDDTGAAGVALPANQSLAVGIWAGSPLSRVTAFQAPALPEANIILVATGLLGDLPRDASGFGLLAIGPDGTVGMIKQNPSVFVLHGSPDAPAVDLFVGGTATELVDNLSFGALSPAVQVPPAVYNLDVRVASSGGLAASFTTPELMAGQRYLAVATGFVGGGQPGFTVLPFAEMFEDSASPLLRVLHASPDAPRVDVGLWDGKSFTPVSGFSDLGFGDASSDMGIPLPTGNLTVGVAGAGSTTPVATFDIMPTMGLKAFGVAAGSLGGTGESFRLLVVDATNYPWQVAEVMPNP